MQVHLLNDERGPVIETLIARTQRQVTASIPTTLPPLYFQLFAQLLLHLIADMVAQKLHCAIIAVQVLPPQTWTA